MRSHVDLENESLDRTDLTADAPRLNPPETNFRLFLMDTNVSRPEDRNEPEAPVPVWRPPSGDLASKPGEVVVTSDSSLWHRTLSARPLVWQNDHAWIYSEPRASFFVRSCTSYMAIL